LEPAVCVTCSKHMRAKETRGAAGVLRQLSAQTPGLERLGWGAGPR